MGKIVTNFTISLDGFIAGANENFDHLFKWYSSGDSDFVFPSGMAVKISRPVLNFSSRRLTIPEQA